MSNPPNTEDLAATEYDANRAAREAARPTRPETDPGSAQPGDRAYEDLPVRGTSQAPLSSGASEPGDMGEAAGASREERPHEHPREDGTGYRG